MSSKRVVVWALVLGIPCALWAWLNSARNDLPYLTRSLVRQIARAEEKAKEEPDLLRRQDRLAHRWISFYNRYRFPEGNPDHEERLFEGLWPVLARCEPESVVEGPGAAPMEYEGAPHERRLVRAEGRDREGERQSVEVEWVRFRANWYINTYRVNGEEPELDYMIRPASN